jgi:nitroreductase
MDVYEAMRSRRSVRRFLDRPVPPDVLPRVVGAALQAPSGGNLQPWHVFILSGARLNELKARIRRLPVGPSGDLPAAGRGHGCASLRRDRYRPG